MRTLLGLIVFAGMCCLYGIVCVVMGWKHYGGVFVGWMFFLLATWVLNTLGLTTPESPNKATEPVSPETLEPVGGPVAPRTENDGVQRIGNTISLALTETAFSSDANWYVIHGGKELGPFSLGQLIDKAAAGQIERDDLVMRTGGLWTKASELDFLHKRISSTRVGISTRRVNTATVAASGIFAVGALLLLWAHFGELVTDRLSFWARCFVWGTIFGGSAWLSRRNKQSNGIVLLAIVFVLAAGLEFWVARCVGKPQINDALTRLRPQKIRPFVELPRLGDVARLRAQAAAEWQFLQDRAGEDAREAMLRAIKARDATGIRARRRWEDIENSFRERFPNANIDVARLIYLNERQRAFDMGLIQRIADSGDAGWAYRYGVAQRVLPVVGPLRAMVDTYNVKAAAERFIDGLAAHDDYLVLGEYVRREQELGRDPFADR